MIWGQLMNDAIIAKALALWGLEGAEVSLIAARGECSLQGQV